MVAQIIRPPNPGSAVCQGAVMPALNPNSVLSRACKKTYGIETVDCFDENPDPPSSEVTIDGVLWCNIYVRKGDKGDVNSCISRAFNVGQRNSDETAPRYTIGNAVKMEGKCVIDISKNMRLDTEREVKVSIYSGGSIMEIKAEAVHFSADGPE